AGLHGEPAIALGRSADATVDVDRNCTADRTGWIKPKIGSRRLVEHALNMHVGRIIAAQPAVFEVGRRAANLDIAFQCETLIVRADLKIRGFDTLSHD